MTDRSSERESNLQNAMDNMGKQNKRDSLPKNANYVIIYSLSFRSKPVWLKKVIQVSKLKYSCIFLLCFPQNQFRKYQIRPDYDWTGLYLLLTGSWAKLEYEFDAGTEGSCSSLLLPRGDRQNNIYTCNDRENIMTEHVILEQAEIKVSHTCSEMAGERKRFYPHKISS